MQPLDALWDRLTRNQKEALTLNAKIMTESNASLLSQLNAIKATPIPGVVFVSHGSPAASTDPLDHLIDAGAALAQELQNILDEGLDAAGESTPKAGTTLAAMQALIADWERAYAAYSVPSAP